MGKRRNQPMIDSDSDSNNDSGSDLDSVSSFNSFSFITVRYVLLYINTSFHLIQSGILVSCQEEKETTNER